MSMRRLNLLVAVVFALNACVEKGEILLEPEDEMEDIDYGPPAATALAQLTATRPGEQAFVDLANAEPTFAGYYFLDDTHMVVAITDTSRAEAIQRAATDNLLQTAPAGTLVPAQVTIQQVGHSFRQLALWRDMIESALLDLDDVVAVDLDEILNRITVYLDTGSGAAQVRAIAEQAQVPEAALHFEVSGEIEPAVDLSPPANHVELTDRIRPVKGGIQVFVEGRGACTLGFTATIELSGPPVVRDTVYLTNSHCTTTNFQVDGDIGWQPTSTEWDTDKIGIEVADPPPDRVTGPSRRRILWRDSDAAAFDFRLSSDRYALGKIARTTYRTFGAGGARGSRTISHSNPHFTVSGEWTWPVAGRYYQKMGKTSGWTYGGIQATCSTVKVDGMRITCAYKINTRTEKGDSGSPVFEWPNASNDRVNLAGMMFARASNNKGWFNPMGAIEDDLGPLGTRF